MSDADVLLEQTDGHVRLLTLNRPDKKNALSTDLTAAVVDAIDRAAADDAVRVIGLTGAGETFCAGADLSPGQHKGRGQDTVETAVKLVTHIRVQCEKPVIAGINGLAIGAGLSLALLCDLRMASSRASFHPGYARAGTSPDCGLTWSLPQAVGHERALRFLLELEFVDAEAALALGLVGDVVSHETFAQDFVAYCHKIAQVAPLAARQTKLQVTRAGLPDDLEAVVRDELRYTGRGLASNDGREAVRAIFEKRAPHFTGT